MIPVLISERNNKRPQIVTSSMTSNVRYITQMTSNVGYVFTLHGYIQPESVLSVGYVCVPVLANKINWIKITIGFPWHILVQGQSKIFLLLHCEIVVSHFISSWEKYKISYGLISYIPRYSEQHIKFIHCTLSSAMFGIIVQCVCTRWINNDGGVQCDDLMLPWDYSQNYSHACMQWYELTASILI